LNSGVGICVRKGPRVADSDLLHRRLLSSAKEVEMPQRGKEKQVPLDQRARGKNPEHPEGQANIRNDEGQKARPLAPAPTKPKK